MIQLPAKSKPIPRRSLEDFRQDLNLSLRFFRESARLIDTDPAKARECYARAHAILDRVEIAVYGHILPYPYPDAKVIYIDPLPSPLPTQTEQR